MPSAFFRADHVCSHAQPHVMAPILPLPVPYREPIMPDASPLAALDTLPPLWATEARETPELILPLRFTCGWHALSWYPVERNGDVLFGFTTRVVPEWCHFHIRQVLEGRGPGSSLPRCYQN